MHLSPISASDTLKLLLTSVRATAENQLDDDKPGADVNRGLAHAQLDRLIDRLVKEARKDGEAERGGYARALFTKDSGR
jgi:hypothetical protein